ncbi:MAG: nitroreductase family protein [Chloroflexi bacterium]|nr:nitroreductase family protein [Chloroflexota bacterium]
MDRFAVDNIPIDPALRTPVIDQMARHVSSRSFDSSRPLPEGIVPVLVAAAQSASTSSNLQTWSVVALHDPERKHQMREYCANQAFIDEAPLFLAFCDDTYRLRYACERQGYPLNTNYLELLLLSAIDSALACQNAALAAESLGLGCCMVGAIRERPREVAEFLGLPHGVFGTIGLAVGYPKARNPVKPRLPQSIVVHHERYSAEGLEEAIAAYDARIDATHIYDNRHVYVPGITPEPSEDNVLYGWAEHTARRLTRTTDPRKYLGDFVRERGFVTD